MDLDKEIWRDVKGFEDFYKISNYGRIKSLNYNHTKKERILKPEVTKKGYLRIKLCKNGEEFKLLIHVLVAKTFLGDKSFDGLQVNHKNEIKDDNRVENLEWCTPSYNVNYGNRNLKVSKIMTNGVLSKKVYQYTLKGVFIKEWASLADIERTLNFHHSSISKCCNGKMENAYGFIWRY